MMNITYRITEEIYSLGIDSRMSYGIAAYVNAEEEGTATVVSSIHDITADKQALAGLVVLCNRSELSLILLTT